MRRRPTVSNLSLGAKTKVELVAELLSSCGHRVDILSQGEVVEPRVAYYPSFREPASFHPEVAITYASAVPVRLVNGWWSSASTLRILKERHTAAPYDMVVIYNLKAPQVACARYALRNGIPVVLEYEDDRFLEIFEPNVSRITSGIRLAQARRLLGAVSGCVAGSPDLLSQLGPGIPKLLLPGVIDSAVEVAGRNRERRNWVVFSGTHSRYQGLDSLIRAWRMAPIPGWQLHIAGHGDQTEALRALAAHDPSIVFRGILSREENAAFLSQGKVTVVAYEVSKTRGFSFKTLECLGAGLHVITTRLSALAGLDEAAKVGITFLDDSTPGAIARTLNAVISNRRWERTSQDAAIERYGVASVRLSLDAFVRHVSMSNGRAQAGF